MIKILNGFSWLEDELGDDTKEVKECLEEGLIKRLYGNEDLEPYFVILESNIPKVKEILKEDYSKLREMNLLDYIRHYPFGDTMTLTVGSIYNNEVEISSDDILDDVEDNYESYFDKEKLLEIYNSDIPKDIIHNVLDEIGRTQARVRIEILLDNIKNQKFA